MELYDLIMVFIFSYLVRTIQRIENKKTIILTFRGNCICFAVQYHCFYNLISLLLLG